MTDKENNIEVKIFLAAYNTFLLFGYHGTKLHQIALEADVNKSVIHYYFRSKERLYIKVIKKVFDLILESKVNDNSDRRAFEKATWFLITELYNNKTLFERNLKELYPDDWGEKLRSLMNWLEIKDILYCHVLDYNRVTWI